MKADDEAEQMISHLKTDFDEWEDDHWALHFSLNWTRKWSLGR